MRITELFESKNILVENLTKGSENILKNAKLVTNIAAQLRDDFTIPSKMSRQLSRMDDDEAVQWFLGELDRMEQEGADGVPYSREGKLHMWIAQNYANGSDLWEDIEGELQDTLRDFMILRNRNLLADRHQEINNYKGVKALHRYLVTHYQNALNDVRESAKSAAMTKKARSILLADVPEYKLYLLQNRGAAIIHGKGATFCTANTNSDVNWNSYSSKGALFGLIPKGSMVVKAGGMFRPGTDPKDLVQEKFQFDGPSHSFRNNLDINEKPETIKERFPYLLDDLIKGLNANKTEIESPASEPNIEKKSYEVDKTLEVLKKNLSQYFTDKKRPVLSEEDVNNIAWFEENFKENDMINITNPRATPRIKFLGAGTDSTKYRLEKPDGEIVEVPKARVARVNKAAAEHRAAGEAGNEPDVEEPTT
jgi:hypothetical protein